MLLASIHDVGPRSQAAVDRLAELLDGIVGQARFAMLVVPDHWGEAPLARDPAFQRRLRGWADAGVEMFVHGWFHKDVADHAGLAALKARHLTAREGEFLGLTLVEAAQRMADGKALIEDVIGRAAAGFIAPAWLYGPGAHAALAQSGFALAEDHFRVWRPADGAVLSRGPVITWASRSAGRRASSLAVAAIARHVLPGACGVMPVARVAVHPGDTTIPALMRSIARTVTAAARGRRAGRYADLAAPVAPTADATARAA